MASEKIGKRSKRLMANLLNSTSRPFAKVSRRWEDPSQIILTGSCCVNRLDSPFRSKLMGKKVRPACFRPLIGANGTMTIFQLVPMRLTQQERRDL